MVSYKRRWFSELFFASTFVALPGMECRVRPARSPQKSKLLSSLVPLEINTNTYLLTLPSLVRLTRVFRCGKTQLDLLVDSNQAWLGTPHDSRSLDKSWYRAKVKTDRYRCDTAKNKKPVFDRARTRTWNLGNRNAAPCH